MDTLPNELLEVILGHAAPNINACARVRSTCKLFNCIILQTDFGHIVRSHNVKLPVRNIYREYITTRRDMIKSILAPLKVVTAVFVSVTDRELKMMIRIDMIRQRGGMILRYMHNNRQLRVRIYADGISEGQTIARCTIRSESDAIYKILNMKIYFCPAWTKEFLENTQLILCMLVAGDKFWELIQ